MNLDQKLFTREQRIYLALWRKAYREPNVPVQIVLSTKSLAISTRLNFYRVIMPFRTEKLFDEELKKAAEQFTVSAAESTTTPGTWIVSLLPRKTLEQLESQLQFLGISEDDLLLPEEKINLEKLAEFIQPEAHKPSSTEFYDRG